MNLQNVNNYYENYSVPCTEMPEGKFIWVPRVQGKIHGEDVSNINYAKMMYLASFITTENFIYYKKKLFTTQKQIEELVSPQVYKDDFVKEMLRVGYLVEQDGEIKVSKDFAYKGYKSSHYVSNSTVYKVYVLPIRSMLEGNASKATMGAAYKLIPFIDNRTGVLCEKQNPIPYKYSIPAEKTKIGELIGVDKSNRAREVKKLLDFEFERRYDTKIVCEYRFPLYRIEKFMLELEYEDYDNQKTSKGIFVNPGVVGVKHPQLEVEYATGEGYRFEQQMVTATTLIDDSEDNFSDEDDLDEYSM